MMSTSTRDKTFLLFCSGTFIPYRHLIGGLWKVDGRVDLQLQRVDGRVDLQLEGVDDAS